MYLSIETQNKMYTYKMDGGKINPEIVYRVKKKHHAGLIVRSPRLERVGELLDDYGRRFAEDFVAVLPPMERPE